MIRVAYLKKNGENNRFRKQTMFKETNVTRNMQSKQNQNKLTETSDRL